MSLSSKTKRETLELMSDEEFMGSYKKSRDQIKKRDFVDWNALENPANKGFCRRF